MHNNTLDKEPRTIVQYGYWFTMFMLTLSGFAQMPIFKRYYIADIPGLGWLNQFYVTHFLHYLFAVILFVLVSYLILDFLLPGEGRKKISLSGYARIFFLAGLILSGVFLVVKNFPGYRFHPSLITIMIILHLALVMAFLLFSLYCIISAKKWYRTDP